MFFPSFCFCFLLYLSLLLFLLCSFRWNRVVERLFYPWVYLPSKWWNIMHIRISWACISLVSCGHCHLVYVYLFYSANNIQIVQIIYILDSNMHQFQKVKLNRFISSVISLIPFSYACVSMCVCVIYRWHRLTLSTRTFTQTFINWNWTIFTNSRHSFGWNQKWFRCSGRPTSIQLWDFIWFNHLTVCYPIFRRKKWTVEEVNENPLMKITFQWTRICGMESFQIGDCDLIVNTLND